MVGGTVIEVAEVKDRPDILFVDCRERTTGYAGSTCAIYVERNKDSERIEVGDSLWWQGGWAMWTPQANRVKNCNHRHHESCNRTGIDYDIKIPRRGYSGVEHPARRETQ